MAYTSQLTDAELEVWQKKQIDRCRVENAINKLIETYGILDQRPDVRLYNERSQNLEESAILMAISEHGLHQNSSFRLDLPQSEHDLQRPESFYAMCGPSRSTGSQALDERHNGPQMYSDDGSDSSTSDSSHLLDAAVSVAIQKQGLGLSGLNR